jgi:asparagine synthase (glutamine-hydrolysing)
MCGILGVYKKSGVDKDLFINQLNSIYHRGPDDHGVFFTEEFRIGLGSRRLAIQDLSINGHMPMSTNDGNYTIIYNGEIYNKDELRFELVQLGEKFTSNSDTECVLYAYKHWGVKCLQKLTGMFSIGIYDKVNNLFFLARDRAGEKPLYYWNHNNGFSFSSELKQLLLDNELPRNLDLKATKQYFEDGFSKGDVSFIKDVFKLPAGHYLIYDFNNSKFETFKYWDIPLFSKSLKSKDELLEQLDILLSASVKRQMISDVPLGVLLSGGVDSSLITSYAAENSTALKTFHISFKGFGKYDESIYAKQVADYFGTNHYELSGNEIGYEMIDEMLEYFDEPLGDSSMLPTFLVAKLTKEHVTVALGGDGGDELFGGYSTYSNLLNDKSLLANMPKANKKLFELFGSKLPIGFKGRNFLVNLTGSKHERFINNRIFDKFSIKNIFSDEYSNKLDSIESKIDIDISGDFIFDITKYDFNNYLVDDILVKVDRASMASSIELRAPFLDKSIIEFAFSQIPSDMKVGDGSMKIILKDLLNKRMPKLDFDLNRKQGFSIPLNDWIADKWQQNFLDEINNLPNLFNKNVVKKMCLNVKRGYSNSTRLYAIIIFSKWIRKYNINY